MEGPELDTEQGSVLGDQTISELFWRGSAGKECCFSFAKASLRGLQSSAPHNGHF